MDMKVNIWDGGPMLQDGDDKDDFCGAKAVDKCDQGWQRFVLNSCRWAEYLLTKTDVQESETGGAASFWTPPLPQIDPEDPLLSNIA